MKIVLVVIFIFVCNHMFADDYKEYYVLCNKALAQKVVGNNRKAIEYYEKAFNKKRPFVDDLKELYGCYMAIDDKVNAYKTLEKMVLYGFQMEEKSYLCIPTNPVLEKFNNASFVKDSALLNKLNLNYNNLKTQCKKIPDESSAKYIQSIITNDRFIGYIRTRSDSTVESIISNVGFVANANIFLNLIKKNLINEAIPFDIYGDYFYLSLMHIVQSVKDKDDIKILFDFLKRQVVVGNLHPYQYAVYFDQNYVRVLRNRSYYGTNTIASFNEQKQKLDMQVFPIEDPDKLDIRRECIYLAPLWVYAKKNNFTLPNEYKYE